MADKPEPTLRELIEKTVAKALIMLALTPRGVERDIPAECATDLLGHLEEGEPWFDEAEERMDIPLSRILSDALDLDGHVTDVVHDSEWRLEARRELLAAALGGTE
jgi:hypothetical protein